MVDSDFTYESNSMENATPVEMESAENQTLESDWSDPASNEVSEEFVGQWNNLISTTNWEKGKIILEWRQALIATESPATCYSDEAWCRRVGGVTSQHVGRLRRVYERFGEVQSSYPKIYWSHFLAASDWDDAEMWLEGASQSKWSITEMRESRWKTLGLKPETQPRHEELAGGVVDEDYVPLTEIESERGEIESKRDSDESLGPTGKMYEDADFGEGDERAERAESSKEEEEEEYDDFDPSDGLREQLINPFVGLPVMPTDVAEALEQFKLSVIRHRASSWSEISQEEMLNVVDALRQFVMNRAE